MNGQEILVGVLVIAAVAYLINYFYKQTQTHDCDDCSLMKMKQEADASKSN